MISNSIKKREAFTGSWFQQSIKIIANGLVALYIIYVIASVETKKTCTVIKSKTSPFNSTGMFVLFSALSIKVVLQAAGM